jgi:peroxiredoxin
MPGKKKRILNITLLVFILFIFCLLLNFFTAGCNLRTVEFKKRGSNGSETGEKTVEFAPQNGSLAPLFSLKDLEGETLELEAFRGSPVILNFWTTWCSYCVDEMPHLQELHTSGKDVVVLAINVQEDKKLVQKFIDDKGFTFPVLLDSDGEVFKNYRLRAFPTTFALNAEGVVTSIKIGAFNVAGLEKLVRSAREK